jgi:aminopeptidase YwaD
MKERIAGRALQTFVLTLSLLAAVSARAQTGPASPKNPRRSPSSARKPGIAAKAAGPASPAMPKVCAACIRAQMDFLASDALRGRGSGTPDELLAATYVGAQLEQYGVEPAGDDGTYVQRATVERQTLAAPPQLRFMTPGDGIPAQQILWTHGKQMLTLYLSDTKFKGPLKRVDADRGGPSMEQTAFPGSSSQEAPDVARTAPGAIVLVLGKDRGKVRAVASAAVESGATAVLVPASPDMLKTWDERGKELPKLPKKLEGSTAGPALGGDANVFALGDEALANLNGIPDGTVISFDAAVGAPEKNYTWNAVGKIAGSDPLLGKSVILLSAHLDHLGVGPAVNGDSIYNGADDDASGTVAVLELARALASGPKPKRTVLFALFGGEEDGGLGSSWFEEHPPEPLAEVTANLEFEMIGRPDPKYPRDSLWLSGWERSNLGPALAAHGAKLVADARPEEHFFMRSDNYVLAKKGTVAQTASSFGLHADYHQPSDDLAHIDFQHMITAIESLIGAVKWLVNSDFQPKWNAGGKP